MRQNQLFQQRRLAIHNYAEIMQQLKRSWIQNSSYFQENNFKDKLLQALRIYQYLLKTKC
ncbi:unnamed protein product [Paramecium sonneborni]|uniref:Uncharacterized protein n=1 Tax=Paramecium sonneborni TaxID=65129 RepID=A0A8S1PBB0_9CILI|nr:unnamed protein product [Paramecium sonneborni]